MPYKDKEARKTYQRQYQRQLRAGGHYSARDGTQNKSDTRESLFPDHYRIGKAQDLLCVLEDAINAVRTDDLSTPLQKARVLGYLVGVGIRVVETANLEGRVEALERVLAVRPTPTPAEGGIARE